MRYALLICAILLTTYLAWPADDHVLVNHLDACTMARAWHDVTRTDQAWADVVSRCGWEMR